VPYAGPPCFLDPQLRHHNRWIPEPGIFPDNRQALDWLRLRLPDLPSQALRPGDQVDLGSGLVRRDPFWDGVDLGPAGLDGYLDGYTAARAGDIAAVHASYPDPEPAGALDARFAEHFERLGGMSTYFNARINLTLRFEVDGAAGGVWDVGFAEDGVRVDLRPRRREPQYRLSLQARWLDAVISGRMRWEDLFLSLRFSAWREPDVYNDYLVGLLKPADPSALEAVEDYETRRDPDQTVTLTDAGRRWQVSRFCPHAVEDLAEGAVIQDGVLRCLGHNFDFDLGTGACLNARCDPITVRTLPAGTAVLAGPGD
jgi:nitrite reductase/ring-hydroxylating ferredoxin subunit